MSPRGSGRGPSDARLSSGRQPLPDKIPHGVRVLFVGINPGLRSAAIGHHFAGHSNRFWKLLHQSGLVPEQIGCEQDHRLAGWGYGLTNLVPRPTSGIDALRREEYEAGRRALIRKVRRYHPDVVALVGVTLYRFLFPAARGKPPGRPAVFQLGLQPETIEAARLFVLPNPSGRNAGIPYPLMFRAFESLKEFLDGAGDSRET
jgi:TDG/mug DNA glycosylase family protein